MSDLWNAALQSASLMAAFGACTSSLATWFTVRDMRKQREAAQKPDIVVSDFVFEGRITNIETWTVADRSIADARVRVSNLGLGAAKRIRIAMRCMDSKGLVSSLNAALHVAGSRFSVELDERQFAILYDGEDALQTHAITSFGSVSLSHLLPMGHGEKDIPVDARLPFLTHVMACAVDTYDSSEIKSLFRRLNFVLDLCYQDSAKRETRESLSIYFAGLLMNHEAGTYTARFACA